MWHLIVWIPVAAALALWSGLCWLLHEALAQAGAAAPSTGLAWLERWQIPAWLTPWLPMEAIGLLKAWLTDGTGWLEAAAGHWPLLAGWLQPMLGLAWLLGAGALLLGGLLGSLIVGAVRASSRRPAAPARR